MMFHAVLFALIGICLAREEVLVLDVSCDVEVVLSYSEDADVMPDVSCNSACNSLDMGWFQQRMFHRDQTLENKFGLMVEANSNQEQGVVCKLVPSQTDAEIKENEAKILDTCLIEFEKLGDVILTPPSPQIDTTPAPTDADTEDPDNTEDPQNDGPGVSKCQEGYTYIEVLDTCYLFSDYLANWQDAECACAASDGVLAVIDSAEEQEVISAFLTESVWIGLSDATEEGVHEWRDLTPLDFESWASTEPNNKGYYDDEDCVEMRKAVGFNWNDEGCEARRMFVCEAVKPVEEKTIVSEELCPDGWTKKSDSNTCYHVSPDTQNFIDSEYYCNELGGSLISIQSNEEMEFVRGILPDETVWIGLTDSAKEGYYRWNDGKSFIYESWIKNKEPTNSRRWSIYGEDCVQLDSRYNFNWNTGYCSKKLRAVCLKKTEVFPRAECPAGWQPDIYESCYRMSKYSTTFDKAVDQCSLMTIGSKLLTPINDAHNKFVTNILTNKIWLGLTDRDVETDFRNLEGAVQSYFNWDRREPNDYRGEDCVEMDEKGTWNDQDCDRKYHFLCTIPQFQPIPGEETS